MSLKASSQSVNTFRDGDTCLSLSCQWDLPLSWRFLLLWLGEGQWGEGNGAANTAHQVRSQVLHIHLQNFAIENNCAAPWVCGKGINGQQRRAGISASWPQQVLTDSRHLWDLGQEEMRLREMYLKGTQRWFCWEGMFMFTLLCCQSLST